MKMTSRLRTTRGEGPTLLLPRAPSRFMCSSTSSLPWPSRSSASAGVRGRATATARSSAAPATAAVASARGSGAAWRWWRSVREGAASRPTWRGVAGARRGYVTLQELRQGGELRLVYNGPPPETIRVPGARSPSFIGSLFRILMFAGFLSAIYPFTSGIAFYLVGMDRSSFERVMLWWLKYREMGRVTPPVGLQMVDGVELQKIIDSKIGRPYTMELLDPQDPEEKLKNLPARMDGVELLVISGRKNFFNISIPYISVGFHARIRWTETVKIVGPKGIAHLDITLRTISNPEKRDLSTQLLGLSRRMVIERVELKFADNTSVALNEASFGRQKRYPATRLKD